MKHKLLRLAAGVLAALTLSGLLCGYSTGVNKVAASLGTSQLNDKAYTIGVAQGASGQNVVTEEFPEAKVNYYTRDVDAYLAVQQGKVDAFLYDEVTMEFAIANGLTGVKLLPEDIGPPIQIAMGISPKSSVPELQQKFNQFLTELRTDGTLEDMQNRWIKKADDTMPDIPTPEKPALTIKVGTTGSVQPFSYYKGDQLAGYDIEMIKRFASWMNADVKISVYDYDGIVAAAESGAIDCILANLNITEERKASIQFSDPIYESHNALLVQDTGTTATATSTVAAVDPNRIPPETARVGVMEGSTNEIYAEKHYPDADRQSFKNYVDSCAALSAGKLDYAMMDYTNALRFTRSNPQLEIVSDFLTDEKLCIGVSKNNPELYEKAKVVVDQFLADGTVEKAISHWIKPDGSDYEAVETPKLPDAPKIKVAIVSSREPTTFVMDGKYVGLDIELIDRVLYELGYQAEYLDMEWGAVMAAVGGGKVDMTLGMYNTPERAEKLLFTEPYFANPQLLVAQKSETTAPTTTTGEIVAEGEYTSVSQLAGKKLACLTGSIFDRIIDGVVSGVEYSYFNTTTDGVVALRGGKVEGVIVDEPVGEFILAQNDDVVLIPEMIAEDHYGMVLAKNSPLTPEFNKEVSRMRQDGTLDKMFDKWVHADENTKLPVMEGAAPNGTLRVACTVALEPMCYTGKQGTPVGCEVEMIMEIAKALGKKVELISVDFAGLIPMVQSGKADVAIGCMSISEERKQTLDMTDSHRDGGIAIVVRESKTPLAAKSDAKSETPLETANFGVMTGSTAERYIGNTYPDATISTFSAIADAMTALSNGKIDFVMTAYTTSLNAVRLNPALEIYQKDVVMESSAIAVDKSNVELLEKIDAVLAQFRADGTLDAIVSHWTTQGQDYVREELPVADGSGGTLRVAVAADREPMCFVLDGDYAGLDCELIERIAYELGMKVEYQNMQFSSLVAALSSGKADVIISNMTPTDERRKSVNFTQTYFDNPQVLVSRAAVTETAVVKESFFEGLKQSFIRTFITESRWKLVLNGLVVTVVLSICSGVLGSVIGFGICMLRRSKMKAASIPAAVLIRVIQGTPIVVLLMILYYIIFGKVDVSAVFVAILGFSVNFGVYVSEMIRTGIDAVDNGQIEAAHALGFTRMRTFWKITFPQAARHFLPVFKGEFISMVKMTSVVGYIAIQDLTKVSDIIRSRTLEAFFPLIATAVLYFIVANLLTILLSRLEIKLDPKRRKRTVKGVVTK